MLTIDKGAAIHRLCLDNPARMNALTTDALLALREAIDAAGADEACRAVLLTGTGRAFCSGADLNTLHPGHDPADVLDRFYNPLVRAMRGLLKPIVCAVNGVAAGAGANLALACDIVIAAESARFVQAFIRIGLIPDAGGTFLLPRLVGDARARAAMMLGEPVEARVAAEWGMIWRVVPDDVLPAEAMALAERLAALPTQAIGMIKRALEGSAANGLEAQLALERDLQGVAARTPDVAEGIAAFLGKRAPVFTGGRG